jgi:2-aminoethylphosphonate-pyruvate transaminase
MERDGPVIHSLKGLAGVMAQNRSKVVFSETGDPFLLTPGPLTTSRSVKLAMLHDWGSRDASFIRLNAELRESLLEIAAVQASDYVAVPIQGSGTFAVEAMLTSVVPPHGHILLLINGAYGHRAKRICDIAKRRSVVLETAEDCVPEAAEVEQVLQKHPSITHIFLVHCETTSGILNPLQDIADLAKHYGKDLLVDAMSSFGAMPINAAELGIVALAASSNKCLQGVPGFGFVICNRRVLEVCQGHATSLVLDLYDQYCGFQKNGQWRFTPPTHVIVALHQAIAEMEMEGGVAGRGRRYRENCRILIEGMQDLGFRPLLSAAAQAPIIVTFRMPGDRKFNFSDFYDALKDRGYVIYPGKLTVADSFRIGCIGDLRATHMRGLIVAVREILETMGVRHGAPAAAA